MLLKERRREEIIGRNVSHIIKYKHEEGKKSLKEIYLRDILEISRKSLWNNLQLIKINMN